MTGDSAQACPAWLAGVDHCGYVIVNSTEVMALLLATAGTHPGIFSSGSEKGADLLRPTVLTGNPVRMVDMAGPVSEPLLLVLASTSRTPTQTL